MISVVSWWNHGWILLHQSGWTGDLSRVPQSLCDLRPGVEGMQRAGDGGGRLRWSDAPSTDFRSAEVAKFD